MYMPSIGKEPTMGKVVIQIDISGSVSKKEIAHYNGHFKRIVEQCKPERVYVIYTDTAIQRSEVFERGDEVEINYYSGGGTYMPAGFDWVTERGITPDVFICLTDGFTDFGEEQPYPVVWCISSDAEAPHGETIHFEME